MTDFKRLLSVLTEARVEFVLVGGMAAIVHGGSHVTEDLHIVYRRSSENIDCLVRALSPQRHYLRAAPPNLPFMWDAKTIGPGPNFTLNTALGQIDLLGEIVGGGSYDDLLPYCTAIEVYGMSCMVIRLERLIHVKRAAGRRKDLDAIAELELLRDQMSNRRDDA